MTASSSRGATATRCPRCDHDLKRVEKRGAVLEICSRCEGMYLDPGDLEVLLALYRKVDEEGATAGAGITCPRCELQLWATTHPACEVTVGRCPGCQVVWHDGGALEQLQSAVLRILPPEESDLGQQASILFALLQSDVEQLRVKAVACPRCGRDLEHLPRESGNLVERCASCRALWFHAGELTLELKVYRQLHPKGRPAGIDCLSCGQELVGMPFPGTSVPLEICPGCRGVWIGEDRLAEIIGSLSDVVLQASSDETEDIQSKVDTFAAQEQEFSGATHAACPICQGRLDVSKRSGMPVDTCVDCGGTWFDSGELTIVLGVSRKIRLKRAEPTDLICPRCPGEQKLLETAYPSTDVKIDVCPDCRGNWLDQGELERLAETVGRPPG